MAHLKIGNPSKGAVSAACHKQPSPASGSIKGVLRQTPKSSLVSIAACAAESIRPFFGSGEGVLVHGFIWDILPENFSRKPAFLVHRFLGHKYLQYLFSIPWEPKKTKHPPTAQFSSCACWATPPFSQQV